MLLLLFYWSDIIRFEAYDSNCFFFSPQKHGIVLGPDLSLNGDTSETETDVATSGGDAAPQQAQPTSPSEGNSMLGKTHLENGASFLFCMALHQPN